jgi:uncharacterized damage-inducible protein DinB
MNDWLKRLFEHMRWADERVLRLYESDPRLHFSAALRVLAHVAGAERVWLLRIRGESSASQPVWPEIDLPEIARLLAENAAGYGELVAATDDAALEREVAYTNTKGASFRTRLGDILLHVALHGSYHRGQLASAARAAGAEPVLTDYIEFARS